VHSGVLHLKLSSLVSDLLGPSARRMLQAVADGENEPATMAALASHRLRATPAQLCDLHDCVIYEERGPAVTKARAQRRAAKMIRELRSLGYRIEVPSLSENPA
jgi:hypothetical protein